MVPVRYAFRNRWWSLFWAAGICLSAARFATADSPPHGTDAAPTQAHAEANVVENNNDADAGDLGAAVEALNRSNAAAK